MNELKLIKTVQKEIYLFDTMDKEFPNDAELGAKLRAVIRHEVKNYNSTKN